MICKHCSKVFGEVVKSRTDKDGGQETYFLCPRCGAFHQVAYRKPRQTKPPRITADEQNGEDDG